MTRLEAFSDAAFAFALTLLVVSLDVPKSYDELMRTMRGFPSFACCFALLVWIWHEHNLFFRRYGLQDGWTVFVNSMLLFVTLFYVYPLKFMFDSMFAQMMPAAYPDLEADDASSSCRGRRPSTGWGSSCSFACSRCSTATPTTRRAELGLTPLEVFDVKMYAGHHIVSAIVGLVAVTVAVAGPLVAGSALARCALP